MEFELLRERVEAVRHTLETASEGRYAAPRLIAVTKTHPVDMILPLTQLGIREIGENRVQEIVEKLPGLSDNFDIHLIGRLQTNKVKYIIDKVCMIQSVDRMELARQIDRQAQKKGISVPVLIQVSPAGEEQKGGVAPQELLSLVKQCAALPGLQVRGLMAIMPNTTDRVLLEELFTRMRSYYEQLRSEAVRNTDIQELSMGMSHDYDLAAKCGATMVRVGSGLFGPRG